MTKEQRGQIFKTVLYTLCAGMVVPYFADVLLCLITGHSVAQPGTVQVEMLSRRGHPMFYVTPLVATLHNILVWICFGSLGVLLAIVFIGGGIVWVMKQRARIQ